MTPSSRIQSILRSAAELDVPIHVHGATPSARAWIIARWALERAESCVVLCSNDESASDLASDIEALSEALGGQRLSACVFPGWEQSLYSAIAPSIRVRLARAAALGAIGANPPPRIIITSLAAAWQATIPPAFLRDSTITVRLRETIESREALVRRLTDAGYLRVDPVEDPGTFAVRGEIVDTFPVGHDVPFRIELFGDQVERIRVFDPATQRTGSGENSTVTELRIPPAREVLIRSDNSSLVRERVKARADDAGIPRSLRDPVLESIREGIHPDHSDGWAPFAYEKVATFWDHLPESWPILWCDELSCLQAWDSFLEEQRRLADEASSGGLILPEVGRLYPVTDAGEKQLRARSKLFLDRIELTDASLDPEAEAKEPVRPGEDRVTPSHRVFVRTNGDLSGASRHALEEVEPKLRLWLKQGFRVIVLASTESQLERIRFLLQERGFTSVTGVLPEPSLVTLSPGTITEGFRWPAEGLVVLTEGEILGTKHVRRPRRESSGSSSKDWAGLQALSDLSPGDVVVHVDHGIGRYLGLARLDLSGAPADFLLLEYANKDKLYLPVYRLNVIQKYAGTGEAVPLDRLGSQYFAKTKEKVREAVKKLAIDLVQLYAHRKIRPGVRFSPRDAAFREFEAKFPFDETPDQLRAIEETLSDMESGKVMDRLVCGDVGYGKTEVAIRAAFRAVCEGKQVAVLVPTTVLCHQHEQSFRARLKDYPVIIESVSRFKSAKEQKAILSASAEGKVDILIGTHRLLSRDVRFQDLGLLVVDEEHRFGVEHKERLKTLKVNTHVLTLTATPIPRTLHMAFSGPRDISLINTPPVDRLPIRTYISKFDEALIQRAIDVELQRGGQVFFVHNRVHSIHEVARRIREIAPRATVGIAHGQMGEKELEEAMMAFYQRRTQVLVCTAIIESGLDVPSANTILINRADAFGLAQLYQIRGRVGRSQVRAYAYLLLPAEGAITEDAKRRLEVIQRFVELGSGFSIASHDLELRGGGDLLGPQQSGHIAAVGFDLYMELLEEAIREIQGLPLEPEETRREPEIKTPFPAFLAEAYVPDVHQRLSLYRRFSAARKDTEVDRLEEELRDRFGSPPVEAQNLLWLIRIKILLKDMGFEALTVGTERVSLLPGKDCQLDPARAIALVSSNPESYQLTPDSKLVARIPCGTIRDVTFGLERLFKNLTRSKE